MLYIFLLILLSKFVSAELIQPSSKILGLGWALFSTILVACFLVTICILLSQQNYAPALFFSSAIIMGLYVMILALIPKYQVGSIAPSPPISIDWSFYPRIVFLSFTTIIGGFSVSAAAYFYCFTPIYAIKEKVE
jgi:hypothetical protein